MEEIRERRKHKRVNSEALIDFITDNSLLIYHEIGDISLGGLSIFTKELEEPGTILDLTINFPEISKSITVKGKVVWCQKEPEPKMGIQFIELSKEDEQVLKEYIRLKVK